MTLEIVQAETEEQVAQIRELFREYGASLGFDLCFQGFGRELRELPGEYAPPEGRLMLASHDSGLAGCVALRRISQGVCELKRMYVRPEFRRAGIGRALAVDVIEEARAIGYRCVRLDSISRMKEAIALYRSLGFEPIEPYRYNPIQGAVYLGLNLE